MKKPNMNSSNASFAVIVLNHNKKDDLLLAMRSLENSLYQNFSVVVVDNGSTDGSIDALKNAFPKCPVVALANNMGAANGRNRGWRYAKEHFDFEYLLFLDDDAEISPDFIGTLAMVYQKQPEVGIVCPKAYTNWSRKQFMSVGLKVNLYTGLIYDRGFRQSDHGQFEMPLSVGACGGFALSTRAALFEKLNGFDEGFSPYGWEDVDFSLRVRKQGFQILYWPQAVVCHKGSKAGRAPNPDYERHKAKNYLLLLRKHTSPLQKITCALFIVVKCCHIFLEMILTGNAHVIFFQARGFLEGLVRKEKPQENT